MNNILDQGTLHRLQGTVDSLLNSTNVRIAYNGILAVVNGRNKARKSRRYVSYFHDQGFIKLPPALWNSWKALAFPGPEDRLPDPPAIFERQHEWVTLEVPGSIVLPLIRVFRDWIGAWPDWIRADRLVEVALLDPVVTGWSEDGSPIYEKPAQPSTPGWWSCYQKPEGGPVPPLPSEESSEQPEMAV